MRTRNMLAGLAILVNGCVLDFTGNNPVTGEDIVEDIGLPARNDSDPWASKIFTPASGVEGMIGGAEGDPTWFEVTRDNPAIVVAGFSRPFSTVYAKVYSEQRLEVVGSSGVPVHLAKTMHREKIIGGFKTDPSRTISGYTDGPVHQGDYGGEINLRVGYTPERVLIFEVKPLNAGERAIVGVDWFYCQ